MGVRLQCEKTVATWEDCAISMLYEALSKTLELNLYLHCLSFLR